MTGMEAWKLFEPYINPMQHEEFNNKEMSEAFIMLYIACQELDRSVAETLK